jgi:hypothetical protein
MWYLQKQPIPNTLPLLPPENSKIIEARIQPPQIVITPPVVTTPPAVVTTPPAVVTTPPAVVDQKEDKVFFLFKFLFAILLSFVLMTGAYYYMKQKDKDEEYAKIKQDVQNKNKEEIDLNKKIFDDYVDKYIKFCNSRQTCTIKDEFISFLNEPPPTEDENKCNNEGNYWDWFLSPYKYWFCSSDKGGEKKNTFPSEYFYKKDYLSDEEWDKIIKEAKKRPPNS